MQPHRVDVLVETFDRLEPDSGLLSPTEAQRAAAFATTALRDRWISGRSWLRRQLAEYVGEEPGRLDLRTTPLGRPYLHGVVGIDFNLSHTDAVIGLALSTDTVGLDLENAYAGADLLQVAETVCNRAELAELQAGDASEGFARMWTRKEAVLKAEGSGFRSDPTRLDVGTGPTPRQHRSWSITDLGPWPLAGEPVWCAVASTCRKPEIFLRMP